MKTWCTLAARADVLMLLARTDTTAALKHRGLSLFIVPKERGDGHGFVLSQEGGGKLEGRPIDTIGYRGMHSYEVAFENWHVPAANLVGGAEGVGQGFYLTMGGFENGRLQTAGRAIGVMQAAYEAALDYASNRVVFGDPLGRLPAHPGEAHAHGGGHSGHAAIQLPGRPPHGAGQGDDGGVAREGLRVPGRRVGDP